MMNGDSRCFCDYCGKYVQYGVEHCCVGTLNEAQKRLESRVRALENLESRTLALEREKRYEAPLSARERVTIELMAQGKRNQEIADELAVAPQTVKNFVTRIFRKLGVRNRTEAALRWRDRSQI
jgi:DNA-binding NarL/FixJ family response regulator